MNLTFEQFKKGLGSSFHETCSIGGGNIEEICTDSRCIKQGQFFWPLSGENFDGHRFIPNAVKAGCCGFVFSGAIDSGLKSLAVKNRIHAVSVSDTLTALQNLARHIRRTGKAKIIAVTGSNGKTTTKNLIASVLSRKFKTVFSDKSFNNHLGVPLTLLKTEADTEYAVLEMGMNHKGELNRLMDIADPDMGIIVNVSSAHLGNFLNLEELAAAKGEMAVSMKETGMIIYNANLKKYAPFNSGLKCVSREFGFNHDGIFLSYEAPEETPEGIRVTVKSGGIKTGILYPGIGAFNAENVSAAAACCLSLGLDTDTIRSGIASFKQSPMRMQTKKLEGGAIIINDAYNANPASAAAAVATLDGMKTEGKKYIVIANMNELGIHSEKFHRELGRLIAGTSIDCVYSFGEYAKHVTEELRNADGKTALHFPEKEAIAGQLRKKLRKGDVVLLKGSRLNRLETIEQFLSEQGAAHV